MMKNAFECTVALYEEQLINSERSLQAAMWHELREQFKEQNKLTYKIFIEPRLQLPGLKKVKDSICIPDLVICNRDRVIGVIELKFKPRGLPGGKGDLKKFGQLAGRKDLVVANNRWEGDRLSVRKYKIEETALFVWAAIGKVTSSGFDENDLLGRRYMRIVYSTRTKELE